MVEETKNGWQKSIRIIHDADLFISPLPVWDRETEKMFYILVDLAPKSALEKLVKSKRYLAMPIRIEFHTESERRQILEKLADQLEKAIESGEVEALCKYKDGLDSQS